MEAYDKKVFRVNYFKVHSLIVLRIFTLLYTRCVHTHGVCADICAYACMCREKLVWMSSVPLHLTFWVKVLLNLELPI